MRSNRLRSVARATTLVLALAFAGPGTSALMPSTSLADVATRSEARLPEGRNSLVAAWTGRYVYIFGGWIGWWSDDIIRFDPSTNEVVKLATKLPHYLDSAGAAFDGRNIYVFGGRKPLEDDLWHTEPSDEILKFDPTTEQISLLSNRLPLKSYPSHAVWAAGRFYVFGSFEHAWPSTLYNQIMSFDPQTGGTEVMNSRLPDVWRPGTAGGFFDGRYLYIISSLRYGSDHRNPISRFDPINDTITTMNATVAHAYSASTAWDGHDAYIFGGKANDDGTFTSRTSIVKFNPGSDASVLMAAELPQPRYAGAAVYAGDALYYLGGDSHGDPSLIDLDLEDQESFLNEIIRYVPSPGPPRSAAAMPDSGLVSTTINWEEPGPNTYGWPISGYKIYRRDPVGPEILIGEVGAAARSFTDICPSITCSYSVSAVNNSGEGQRSGDVYGVGLISWALD